MRKIPDKIRRILAQDPFMRVCAFCGSVNQIQWHHPFKYAGKQINECWSLIPLCNDCHNHDVTGKIKGEFSQLMSLERANAIYKNGVRELYKKYPKFDWLAMFNYLTDEVLPDYMPQARAAVNSGMNLAETFPQIRKW